MLVEVGSNVIRNTTGVLHVAGEEQIHVELDDNERLLLTVDVYDAEGNHVAKLRRNGMGLQPRRQA